MSGAVRTRAPMRRQVGLSLIELMIALVLGLVVVAAVFNVYVGTAKSQRYTAGLQSMQENGRFGLSALQRGIRLAGFSENGSSSFVPLGDGGDARIVVRAELPYDCNGGDTSLIGFAVNTYALSDGAITCSGNVAAAPEPEVLIENIDAFRVLYGIDTDAGPVAAGDGIPNRFVPWDEVVDPSEVVAVRFALLVNSGAPVRSRAVDQTHVVLDRLRTELDDRLLREVFSTTVQLRNRSR